MVKSRLHSPYSPIWFVPPLRYLQMYRRYVGRRIFFVFFLASICRTARRFRHYPSAAAFNNAGEGGVSEGKMQVLFQVLKFVGVTSTWRILLFIFAVFFIRGAFKFFEGAYRARLQGQLLRELKRQMFSGFEQMDYRYYLSRNMGHFMNVINEQVNQFCASFSQYSTLVAGVITAIVYFIIAVTITWQFALMGFSMGLVMLGVLRGLNRYVKRLSRKSAHENGELNKLLVQTLQGFKYAISTGQLLHIKKSVMLSIDRLADYLVRTQTVGAFTDAIRDPIIVAMLMTIIAVQMTVFATPLGPIAVSLVLFYRGMQSVMTFQSLWQKVVARGRLKW